MDPPNHQEPSDSPRRSRIRTGLLSPTASFSSLESSTSTSSPRPLRTSPLLFRILQPTSSASMTLHHPQPVYSQPPSPTTPSQSQTQAQRPSSRSERLLRDALLRDDIERTAPALPTSKTHRRRHSHVPVSTTMPLPRHALANAPRPPSPALSSTRQRRAGSTTGAMVYGGDAEGSVPSTPLRSQYPNPHPHPNSNPQPPSSSSARRGMSPVSNPRSSRNASPSPSPMQRRRQASASQHRPSPLPLAGVTAVAPVSPRTPLQRHHTIHTSPSRGTPARSPHQPQPVQQVQQDSPGRRPRSRQGHPSSPLPTAASPGQPLVMTPHEQVLRARLEKVLNAGRVRGAADRSPSASRRSESESRKRMSVNEVRDEEGGWPWRDREDLFTSSPLYASTSGSSSNSQSSHALPTAGARGRSKTEPVHPGAPAPSPRRSTTAPSGVSSPRHPSATIRHTGTTPPLVADGDATHDEDEDDEDEEDEEDDVEGRRGDLRLLTPPPTPPFTTRKFSLNARAPAGEVYHPSPYKSSGLPARLGPQRKPYTPDEDASSECSSRSDPPSSGLSSSGAMPSRHSQPHLPPASPTRPQFNARKASAQCRAMDGYVSFATVEGLGVPPDPAVECEEGAGEEDERGRGAKGMISWGFRKLLGVGGVEHGQQKEGVVL